MHKQLILSTFTHYTLRTYIHTHTQTTHAYIYTQATYTYAHRLHTHTHTHTDYTYTDYTHTQTYAYTLILFFVVLVPLTELQRKEGYVFFFRYNPAFCIIFITVIMISLDVPHLPLP